MSKSKRRSGPAIARPSGQSGGLHVSPAAVEVLPVRVPLTLAQVREQYAPPRTLGTPEKVWLACDSQLEDSGVYSLLQHSFAMGQLPQSSFLGYGTLQQISQNGMIRACIETVSDDMTRNWISLKREGDGGDDDRLERVSSEMTRLNLQKIFHDAAEMVGYFGGCLVYIDTGESDPERLKTPLNVSEYSTELRGDRVLRFVPIDPMNVFPGLYNSTSPLREDYFRPRTWWILGQEVHASRLLRLVANEVPTLLKPCYNFLGISQSQLLWDYVCHFNDVRVASQRLIGKFSLTVMKTSMAETITQQGGLDELDRRVALLVRHRSNDGVEVIDKDSEEILKLETPLSGVTDIVRQSLEILAAMNRTPAVKLLGISPAGFNATGESDIRNYYDHILSQQEKILRPALETILKILQIRLFGQVDPALTFDFAALSEADRAAEAMTQKTQAETMAMLLDRGVVSPEECRERLAGDPDSGFASLDVSDVEYEMPAEGEDLHGEGGYVDPEAEIPEAMARPKDQAESLEQVALNGAQVASMVDIVTKVALGELPRDSGLAILMAAFPVSEEVAMAIIGTAGTPEELAKLRQNQENV